MISRLRIAMSVVCFICCVLATVLWARSYSRLDILEGRMGSRAVQVSSVDGSVAIAVLESTWSIHRSFLSVVAGDAADWRKGRLMGFSHYRDGALTAWVVPYWLVALMFAGAAIAIYFLPGWRFSLRTLLVTTTAVAIVLGTVIYATQG